MKIYQWIDKYNEKTCFKIVTKYSHGLNAGKPENFYFHTSFWGKYALRLLLVFSSVLLLKKSAYRTLSKLLSTRYSAFLSPEKHTSIQIKTNDIFLTLFGFHYFSKEKLRPLLGDRKILKHNLSFNPPENPLVSIIIPVYNHLDYTYNCLKSIQEEVSSACSYEIIVVDDCSTDSTKLFFEQHSSGIRYLRSESNGGFIQSCNLGADQARGQLLCFLNNDVQVNPNWLEALVKTIQHTDVGCVGSKLIYANGLLQEAGGVVFRDASAANYGRYQHPDHPDYNYTRTVDYCSGASILLRKQDFEFLGKFDKRYTPAYYEDTDICFAVRHTLKKKVVYQPLSSLIHFEGISSGTDVENDPVKHYQKVNKNKFLEKWQNELQSYAAPNDLKTGLNRYHESKTVLFIDDAIPAPDKDSGSNRLFQVMKIVQSLGYHVLFVPSDGHKRGIYFDRLVAEGFEVLYRFPNRIAMLQMLNAKMPQIDFVWICKLQNNSPFEHLFELNPTAKRIFDTIDLHYLRIRREAELSKDAALMELAQATRNLELGYARKADITIAITGDEQKMLEAEQLKPVYVVPNIHENECLESNFKPFEEREDLLFIGGYAHKPNVDAAKWLVEEIMPLVWKVLPEVRLHLLGSHPTAEILNLQSDLVSVPGYVEDVSPYFNQSKIFIAPLRFGAGMKGKIGQSLAYSLPIVTSLIGAEGIGMTSGKDYLQANSAEEFVNAAVKLYHNKILWTGLSEASKNLLENYHPDQVKKIIADFLPNLSS